MVEKADSGAHAGTQGQPPPKEECPAQLPTNTISGGAWLIGQLANLRLERLLVLVIVGILIWMLYAKNEQEVTTNAQRERQTEDNREKERQQEDKLAKRQEDSREKDRQLTLSTAKITEETREKDRQMQTKERELDRAERGKDREERIREREVMVAVVSDMKAVSVVMASVVSELKIIGVKTDKIEAILAGKKMPELDALAPMPRKLN